METKSRDGPGTALSETIVMVSQSTAPGSSRLSCQILFKPQPLGTSLTSQMSNVEFPGLKFGKLPRKSGELAALIRP